VQFNALFSNKIIKYLLIALAGISFIFISHSNTDGFYWAFIGWLILFTALLDVERLKLVSDLFEPRMIFWAVFICAFCTGTLQYFNGEKEKITRTSYINLQLSPHPDDLAEFAFDNIAKELAFDNTVKSFFAKPTAAGRKVLNQKLDLNFLSASALSKYQTKVYLFDGDGKGLFNSDSVDYESLLEEKEESVSTNTPFLFYKESILDRHYYLSYIQIYNDSVNKAIGYIIVDLDLKKQFNETVYPELLQPTANKDKAGEYAHAVYINDKLITQTNDYPFPTFLKDDTLKKQESAFINNHSVSELRFKTNDNRTIVVVHNHSELFELITLFSYLFGILVLMAVFILLYQLYLSYFANAFVSGKFMRLTLRRRVHLAMLAIVFISFLVIGSVTIWFFRNQYRNSNTEKLKSAMAVAKQSVQDYLKKQNAFDADYTFDTVSRSAHLKEYLIRIAAEQKIDINVFDNDGALYNASEDDIYNKGLISHMMRPDAHNQLYNQGKSIVILNERVAGLSYLSAYAPLRDDHGVTLGFINVPFFSSEKDLNFQISNIVVTLINLYAFIFLISSLITIGITRWITSTFNVIIEQFGRLNLQRNERIVWPYDDEIGLLVTEYNKMVNKVEENAVALAQNEREIAWREMARQVAHEIKNPLTPMKLNIQYLRQAMKNDNPNIKQLTEKVSESIIEQIDNLSYIASEFSNFAKMPEARPEELELGELLNKAVELYMDDAAIKVSISGNNDELWVIADRSQLLRVFTNLLENAKQAIPENRIGIIDATLTQEGNNALIAIKDNGTGIPEEVQISIFKPYFTTKSSGTGLGLAMTKKIIEFWKGTIWFETEEDRGTTFYIRLPLMQEGE
jgi:signal transduction histidine kinase